MALVLFGKLTAPSEAAAAGISVTSATIKVGTSATAVGMIASKTAVVSLTAAGVVAVGSVATISGPDKSEAVYREEPVRNVKVAEHVGRAGGAVEERWYYFPEGAGGPVMVRQMQAVSKGKGSGSVLRQNEQANYYTDRRARTVYIENYRCWNDDLSVSRLPTDSRLLKEFLGQIDGITDQAEPVRQEYDGLLVITRQQEQEKQARVIQQLHILDEEYFRYNPSAGMKVVDNRDAMHRRGWTYFTVTGAINGKEVTGSGRLPFVYAQSASHWPWMRLSIGSKVFVDEDFTGLVRPWMGLHTIDTVRRDAAEKQIPFETKLGADGSKAQVILTKGSDKVIYIIDMDTDVVEQILFTGDKQGQLVFEYAQDIDDIGNSFAEPRTSTKGFSILDF